MDDHGLLAEPDGEPGAGQLGGHAGVQPDDVVARLEARVAADHRVHGARHQAQVDALLRGAALRVGQVRLEGLREQVPRAVRVRAGRHPRVHQAGERGAVRRAGLVVGDHPLERLLRQLVAHAAQDPVQLLGGEQVAEHEGVGLLGELVAVGGVALGLQDQVHAADVPVLGAVGLPVELEQVLVALELGEDAGLLALLEERHGQTGADLLPALDLLLGDLHELGQAVVDRVQPADQAGGLREHPRGQHVRVRVVAQAGAGGLGVAVVELVRAHDAVDLVAVRDGVVQGHGHEEPGDLHEHLRAVVRDEGRVLRDLDVPQHGVGDVQGDVPLVVGVVRHPHARARVPQLGGRLLGAVRAGLPRVHGAGPARGLGVGAGLVETPVAVHQQAAGDLGAAQREHGVDVDLVPEDVAAVALAVQAARPHGGVQVPAAAVGRLEHVERVQVQRELLAQRRAVLAHRDRRPHRGRVAGGDDGRRVLAAGLRRRGAAVVPVRLGQVDAHGEPVPVGAPALLVQGQQVAEVLGALGVLHRRLPHGGAGVVVARGDGGDLLQHERHALVHVEEDVLADHQVRAVHGAADGLVVAHRRHLAGAGGHGHVDAGLVGGGLEQDGLAVDLPGLDRLEVLVGEGAVVGDVEVGHAALDLRAHREVPGPVLRHHGQLERGEVPVGQRGELSGVDRGAPALRVLEGHGAGEHAAAQVHLLAVLHEVLLTRQQRAAVARGHHERGPVLDVDHVLGVHDPALDHRGQPVEHPGHVGAGVVDGGDARAGHGAAGAPVPVGQGAQHLAGALGGRVEVVPAQHPRGVERGGGAVLQMQGPVVLDHQVGAGRLESALAELGFAVHADHEAEAAVRGGLHTGDGVLEDHRVRDVDAQLAGSLPEHRRVRLARQPALDGGVPVHDHGEEVQHAAGREHGAGVLGAGDQCDRHALGPQPLEEVLGLREHADAVALEHLLEVALLALGEGEDRQLRGRVRLGGVGLGDVQAAGGEERADPVLAGTPVHVVQVVGGGVEGAQHVRVRGDDGGVGGQRAHGGQRPVEELLPRLRVHAGGVRDDPVHVEDDGAVAAEPVAAGVQVLRSSGGERLGHGNQPTGGEVGPHGECRGDVHRSERAVVPADRTAATSQRFSAALMSFRCGGFRE